jgi:hypothetical protein
MGSVKNNLRDITYGNTKTDAEQRATHNESAPNWKRINKNFFELLETCQWIHAVEIRVQSNIVNNGFLVTCDEH